MKKFITILSAMIYVNCIAQIKFESADSVSKSKAQIYSDTKMFIANKWKSSNNVIQNDDKESGLIILKGSSLKDVSYMGGHYTYIYNYTITFRMKDNKYKVSIENIYCEAAHMSNGRDVTKVEPFEGENCPETGTFSHPGLPKKKAVIMMQELLSELKYISDSYDKEIKSKSVTASDW